MPLLRFLALVVFSLGGILSTRAETFSEWVHAAPPAPLTFNAWTAYPNQAAGPSDDPPAQGLYGYLDLSKLPASAFPIQAFVYYGGDRDRDAYGTGQQPKPPTVSSDITPARVTLETTLDSPDKATALPVWSSPIPMRNLTVNMGTGLFETVRVEVRGHDDALLGRLFIGASRVDPYNWNSRNVVVLNSSQAYSDFNSARFSASQVGHLVPDSRAYGNVKAVWIDGSATGDAALTDAFWRRLLLQGTTISGQPGDIQGLATRLGVDAATPQLVAGFTAAEKAESAATTLQTSLDVNVNGTTMIVNEDGSYASPMKAGKLMHEELLTFSRWYLGLFCVVEALVVFIAFIQLRGRRRVWLWLVIPFFAILYALGGALAAHAFVSTRAEALFEQIELQHEGWPEAFLQTNVWQVRLDATPTACTFPPDSSLSAPDFNYYDQQPDATFAFSRGADKSRYVSAPGASRHGNANVVSWIPAQAPVELSLDGKLTVHRSFHIGWLWDGAEWRDLGELQEGATIKVADAEGTVAANILAGARQSAKQLAPFPALLKPLFDVDHTQALMTAGETLFIGEQDAADCPLENEADYKVQSRRIVVYQFHLPQGWKGP